MKASKYIFIFLITLSILSCADQGTEKWIKEAKKPIRVYINPLPNVTYNNYTLIDAEFNVHKTGMTGLTLPPVIK